MKKEEKLLDAIGEIGEEKIEEAHAKRVQARPRRWIAWAAAACVCLAVGAAVLRFALPRADLPDPAPNGATVTDPTPTPNPTPDPTPDPTPTPVKTGAVIVKAAYPTETPYPTTDMSFDDAWQRAYEVWINAQRERNQLPSDYRDALAAFIARSTPAVLAEKTGKNAVYAPLNVYLALAEMAETAGGETRAQALDLLGAEDVGTLRAWANAMWKRNYSDDGASTCILGSSVWLDEELSYRAETLRTLAEDYFASSYAGEMGSDALNDALHEWINEQTGGLLAEQAEGVKMTPESVFELVTTIYYRAKWLEKFSPENTAPAVFHATDGDATCNFLNEPTADFWVKRGEHFLGTQKTFEQGGRMVFLLPEEGAAPETLLSDPEVMAFLCGENDWDAMTWCYGKLSLPKFDVVSDLELTAALTALGVTDAFESGKADFSPLLENAEGVALSGVQHAARVTVDEEGVTATAFTAMGYGAGGPEEQMDFILDRPFVFAIVGEDGLPLFLGVVNDPT